MTRGGEESSTEKTPQTGRGHWRTGDSVSIGDATEGGAKRFRSPLREGGQRTGRRKGET